MRWYIKAFAFGWGMTIPTGMLSYSPHSLAMTPEIMPPDSPDQHGSSELESPNESPTVESSNEPPTVESSTAAPWSWSHRISSESTLDPLAVIPQPSSQGAIAPQTAQLQISQVIPPGEVPESNFDDRFLQPLPPPQTPPPETIPVTPAPETGTPTTPEGETVLIPVQSIEVVGSTVFTEDDFAPIVESVEGRSVTLEELRGVADQITQLYLNEGYITSRAILVEQIIENGVVQIRVVEGSLETIEVEGNERVNDSYIRSRIRLGGETPLSQSNLEDQLRLLRLDPLFENVEASLRAGTGLGQSILTVRVTEAPPFRPSVSVDNYSPPSVGSEQFGVSASYLSLTGLGDELYASYERSTTGGANLFDFRYRVPINPMNGTIQVRVAPSDYEITNGPSDFADLEIEGNSTIYELSYRQPLVRSPREEFALSLGFTHRDGETLIADTQVESSTTSVFQFGQDYVRRDPQGAWALRSQFNLGTDLLDATTDQIPDGEFLSWLGQVQRVQLLSDDHVLIVQADVQLSTDPLLPSQQFVIGGGESLRGYRQNVRSGDNGFRLSVEDRIAVQRNESGQPILQLAPFIDLGAIWNNGDNPVDLPDQTFLVGIGLGLLWEPLPDLSIRLDYGLPLVDLEDRGENAQDDGFYFSIRYQP